MATFYEKNGFDVEITIGSYLITTSNEAKSDGLCNDLVVSATNNQARTARFSFIPAESTVSLERFQGDIVRIFIRTSNGTHQVFYGFVDTPHIDFIARKVTLECSDERDNRLIQLPKSVVKKIGSYSEAVFGIARDQAEEVEKRLLTVAGDFDFDGYGNYELTEWAAKATADYTLTPSDVLYTENPVVAYTNRRKSINTINMTIKYSYQRLHQQAATFTWNGWTNDKAGLRDWFANGKGSFPTKQAIISATESGDWRKVSSINFTDLWAAQAVDVSGGFLLWQPNLFEEEYRERKEFAGYLKDGDGDFVTVGDPARLVPQYETVKDADGNPVLDLVRQKITDTSSHLCIGATWSSARRFAQTVTEQYNITLKSTQSISKYGVIDAYERVDIADPYDVSAWASGKTISFTTQNFYVNEKNNTGELHKAIQVSLNKARHEILDMHRDVTVTFRTTPTPRPEIDLKHTVDVTIDQSAIGSSASINAKGKVSSFTHVIDFETLEGYTEITLRLSRADGSTTSDTWAVQVPIEDPLYIGTSKSITLGTHLGVNPDPDENPLADKYTGWIGNKEVLNAENVALRTQYPELFVVDFPPIPEYIQNPITYESDNEFDIEVPNDTLTISF